MLGILLNETGDILGIMLTIGINTDCSVNPSINCGPEKDLQAIPLASVFRYFYYFSTSLKGKTY